MAGFSTKAYGSAHYSQTTGVIGFSMTEGTGPYQLNDPQPGFANFRSILRDGALVRYRATSGIKQEIANGRFDYVNNRLSRNRIVLQWPPAPNERTNETVNWGPGRKIIYILDQD